MRQMQKSDTFVLNSNGKFEPVVVESAILYREFQTPTDFVKR
ncbi:hypothetical protein CAMGR0001_0594 [Campylobacter gracilis RM3268]|uniref:Uncharacterized protein n=1 Tax=Campylobacter gracilis RM3268 TaxID=553220 RepID=C8PHZ8_9BACT|nr:hypothetical protein CAMGR0001_0594 [Campylobacter gracilis RM3268]